MNKVSRYFWPAVVMLVAGFTSASAAELTTQDYVEIQ